MVHVGLEMVADVVSVGGRSMYISACTFEGVVVVVPIDINAGIPFS